MKIHALALAAAVLLASGSAFAVDTTYTGLTTLTGPTFNRPLAGIPPTALSAVGTAVHYSTFRFTVTASGSYSYLNTSTGWDNFIVLYGGAFNPAASLTNAILANDDFTAAVGTFSGFSATTLSTGTTYTLVTTGFANTDVGAFTATLTGPGSAVVVAVPEPTSWVLMVAGLAGIGALVRRRSTSSAAEV